MRHIHWPILILSLLAAFMAISAAANIGGLPLVGLLIITSSLWLYFDARKKLAGGRKLEGMGPEGWLVMALVLWVLIVPIYLAERRGISQST